MSLGGSPVVNTDLVPGGEQTPSHAGPHHPQPDKSNPHRGLAATNLGGSSVMATSAMYLRAIQPERDLPLGRIAGSQQHLRAGHVLRLRALNLTRVRPAQLIGRVDDLQGLRVVTGIRLAQLREIRRAIQMDDAVASPSRRRRLQPSPTSAQLFA